MKSIELKSLTLINFKGIRNLEIGFDHVTRILGGNGTGKSTIRDAFFFLLFGTDASGRKDFDIRTLDSDGNIIPELPHEVTATLSIDGTEDILTRRIVEKWTKRRGSNERVFDGLKTEYLYNNVPLKEREFKEKINAISNIDTLRLISDPRYFSSTLPMDKRHMVLLQLFGSISMEDTAKKYPEFSCVYGEISRKTFDGYRRELAARKKAILDEQKNIPARIDEAKRMTPNEDWEELSAHRDALTAKISTLREKIKTIDDVFNNAREIQREREEHFTTLLHNKEKAYNAVIERVSKERLEQERKKNNMHIHVELLKGRNLDIDKSIEELINKISEKERAAEELRQEFFKIQNDNTVTFGDDITVCPCCHRPFDAETIQEKKSEIIAAFNLRKAERKKEINQKGQNICTDKRVYEKKIAELNEEKSKNIEQINAIKEEPLYTLEIKDDTDEQVLRDEAYTEACKLLSETKEIPSVQREDTSDMDAKIDAYTQELTDINARLSKQSLLDEINTRVQELEKRLITCGEELTNVELLQDTVQAFYKTFEQENEENINSNLSDGIHIRTFIQQTNGEIVPDCTVLVNGVPYASANTASQINAGLSLIDTISRKIGISIPIFCDNSESVNEFRHMDAQMIFLTVNQSKTLEIEK